jgi:superfamily I DNA/RNA helicase
VIKFTPEQGDILDYVVDNDGVVLVAAGAGTGKSFLAEQIARAIRPVRGLYTAFNRAIVQAGIQRFKGLNMECRTFHALAYAFVQPSLEIQDITYSCITENVSYRTKQTLLRGIDNFFVSASTDMYDFFEEEFEGDEKTLLCEMAVKYIEKMINEEMNPTFNFMLKYFHLLLDAGEVTCNYDLVILDEINDTTAVSLEIFKLINAPKKLGLGETHQAIYDFLNLVNGFEELSGVPVLPLTQSFRCSTAIAEKIQTFMRGAVDKNFHFVGTDEPVMNGKKLYCTMTNAEIIREIHRCVSENVSFELLRKISEIFAYPMAIITAGQGKEVYQKKFRFLETEFKKYEESRMKGDSFLSYLLYAVDDQETKSAVQLLLSFRRQNINIFDVYARAKKAEVNPNYVIATVFTAKGLEFETVELSDLFDARIEQIQNHGGIQTQDDLIMYRCYYVAASRAGSVLLNATALRSG